MPFDDWLSPSSTSGCNGDVVTDNRTNQILDWGNRSHRGFGWAHVDVVMVVIVFPSHCKCCQKILSSVPQEGLKREKTARCSVNKIMLLPHWKFFYLRARKRNRLKTARFVCKSGKDAWLFDVYRYGRYFFIISVVLILYDICNDFLYCKKRWHNRKQIFKTIISKWMLLFKNDRKI